MIYVSTDFYINVFNLFFSSFPQWIQSVLILQYLYIFNIFFVHTSYVHVYMYMNNYDEIQFKLCFQLIRFTDTMSGIDILQEKIKLLVQGMPREKRNAHINYIMDRYWYNDKYSYSKLTAEIF